MQRMDNYSPQDIRTANQLLQQHDSNAVRIAIENNHELNVLKYLVSETDAPLMMYAGLNSWYVVFQAIIFNRVDILKFLVDDMKFPIRVYPVPEKYVGGYLNALQTAYAYDRKELLPYIEKIDESKCDKGLLSNRVFEYKGECDEKKSENKNNILKFFRKIPPANPKLDSITVIPKL